MHGKAKTLGTRNQPEQTKTAILAAALEEFASHGVAGARTDAIANAAGVNKALLYYYFKDKETLYGATLESVFAGITARIVPVLDSNLPPREKMLAYVGAHFDAVAGNPLYPRLVQQEMMRAGKGLSPHLQRIVEKYQRPMFGKLMRLFEDGIGAGEFRKVDVFQFVPSMVAIIVFYFSSTPMLRSFMPGDPLSPERIAARRAAVLDFISAALFIEKSAQTRKSRPVPAEGSRDHTREERR
ncbi:MAG: TetR/AcrR family transcriptional regulator [Terriglobales bacterium]